MTSYSPIKMFMLRLIANPIYPEAHKHLNDNYSGVMPNPGRLFTDETLHNKLKTDSEILSILRTSLRLKWLHQSGYNINATN